MYALLAAWQTKCQWFQARRQIANIPDLEFSVSQICREWSCFLQLTLTQWNLITYAANLSIGLSSIRLPEADCSKSILYSCGMASRPAYKAELPCSKRTILALETSSRNVWAMQKIMAWFVGWTSIWVYLPPILLSPFTIPHWGVPASGVPPARPKAFPQSISLVHR